MVLQPIDIDHQQVQMLATAVGVREAARKLGLPEATVQAWSAREGWFKPKPLSLPPSKQPVATSATNPVEALTDTVAEDGKATKVAGMRYARRTIEAAAQMAIAEPLKALELAQSVKTSIQTAAIAGAWQEGSGDAKVLNVLSISLNTGED